MNKAVYEQKSQKRNFMGCLIFYTKVVFLELKFFSWVDSFLAELKISPFVVFLILLLLPLLPVTSMPLNSPK
jgi:hypothetical protein